MNLSKQKVVFNLFLIKSVWFIQQLTLEILYKNVWTYFIIVSNLSKSKHGIFGYIVFSRN